jgi:prepilin-type N-terminal cleavage/methylation domain-containing protein
MSGSYHTAGSVRHPGFTLVEVLVVIALLGLVATLAVPLFHTDTPQQVMQRSCERLASLMAMCRAQAMLNGHPVRLTWQAPQDDPKGQMLPVVTHEADPVEAPGEFKPMAASWANEAVVQKNVQVRLVQPGTFDLSSLTKTQGQFDLPAEPSLATVEFHPDGTADPAVFVLTTKLPEGSSQDELQGWVVLDSVSGLAHTRTPPTPEQFDAMLKELAALPDLQFQEKTVEVTEASSTNPMAALLGQSGITQDGLNSFIESLGSLADAGAAAEDASAPAPAGPASPGASSGGAYNARSGAAAADASGNNRPRAGRANRSGVSSGGGRGNNAGRTNRPGTSNAGGGSSDAGRDIGRSTDAGSNASNADETDENRPGGRRGTGRGTGGGRGGRSR